MSGETNLPNQIVLNRVLSQFGGHYYICVVDGVATGELCGDEALWSVARALLGLPPQYRPYVRSVLPILPEDQS